MENLFHPTTPDSEWVPAKGYIPQTGAICPYKAKVIDEILEREKRGEPIVSPRPEPEPKAPGVDMPVYRYKRRTFRRPSDSELGE